MSLFFLSVYYILESCIAPKYKSCNFLISYTKLHNIINGLHFISAQYKTHLFWKPTSLIALYKQQDIIETYNDPEKQNWVFCSPRNEMTMPYLMQYCSCMRHPSNFIPCCLCISGTQSCFYFRPYVRYHLEVTA